MQGLRKSVYIGLGGTGIESILKTKKLFIDEYGEVPSGVQFLGIDSDPWSLSQTQGGVFLSPRERCLLSCDRPRDFYFTYGRELAWMPPRNRNVLPNPLLSRSLRQVRTNGRLLFVYNVEMVKQAIGSAIQRVSSICTSSDGIEPPVCVHVVFSLAGGTGAGIFLDVAYLIRKIDERSIYVKGYAVLPDVFNQAGSQLSSTLRSNAYASLADLDYLMHLKEGDEPIVLNWISDSYTKEDFRKCPTPFDWVYLIDNQNESGLVLNFGELTEAISLVLYSFGGTMGLQEDALLDCLRPYADEVSRWALSLGVSGIVLDKEGTDRLFVREYARQMLSQLLEESPQAKVKLDAWLSEIHSLDSSFLYDPKRYPELSINDLRNPGPEVSRHIQSGIDNTKAHFLPERTRVLENLFKGLWQKHLKYLSIADAKAFLSQAQEEIRVFLQEMQMREKTISGKMDGPRQQLQESLRMLEEESRRFAFLKRKSRIDFWLEEVLQNASLLLSRETMGIHQKEICSALQDILSETDRLAEAAEKTVAELEAVQMRLNHSEARQGPSVVLDFADSEYWPFKAVEEEFDLAGLYDLFGGNWLEGMSVCDDWESALYRIARQSRAYSRFTSLSLSQVILECLPKEKREEVLHRAKLVSMPLLQKNEQAGYPRIHELLTVLVGMPAYQEEHGHALCDRFKAEFGSLADFFPVSTGHDDRVTVITRGWGFQASSLSGLSHWRSEYERNEDRISAHFDLTILGRMNWEGYRL